MYNEEKNVVNCKYKDTVFRMLFSDKHKLLSLYNAINETQYTNTDDLTVTTLENAIYMTVKNDISCVIDMSLSAAVNRAVDECIEEGILREFLLRNYR